MRKLAGTFAWKGYPWFKIWLAFGTLLAFLLLYTSISNYVFISRRIAADQLRREMNRQVVAVEDQVRQSLGPVNLDSVLKVTLEKVDWAVMRGRDGSLLGRAGLELDPSFAGDGMQQRTRTREPITRIRSHAGEDYVVQVSPFRMGRQFATLETGAALDRATAVFWPIRQNLIINCAAGLALLGAILLIALRFRAYLNGQHVERQLTLARQVQQGLLPQAAQKVPHAQVAAEFIPAEQVGGDFYDLYPMTADRLGMVLGDVAGKGIPAALLMGVIHGAVRSSNWTESAADHEEATRRLNLLLCERSSDASYSTMFWSYFEPASGQLHYINAGHCPPVLIRSNGEMVQLDEGGPVLGLLAGAEYRQAAIDVEPGDLLVMYSDGVVEAANDAGEEFGEERVTAIAARHAGGTALELRASVLEGVRRFLGDAKPQDDLTLVVLQFEPSGVCAIGEVHEAELAAV
jgi:sigma-B regulation protein RsbU (phosphoserine phosphatase)